MESQINEVCMDETSESVEFNDNITSRISDNSNYELKFSENTEILSSKNDTNLYKSIIFKVGNSYICPVCKHTFSYLKNLKRHVRSKHPTSLLCLFPSAKRPYKCNDCEKSFKNTKTLQFHRVNSHKRKSKKGYVKNYKCPLCSQTFERKPFSEHLQTSHNLSLKPIKLKFDNYEEFCEWKKAIERVTKSYFSKQHTRETNNIIHHTFICHRSGTYKSEGEKKRKLKAQGSRKIGADCPATMKVVVMKEGKCEVTFQSQHAGHENDLQHLSLTYEERVYIADKLATKLPLSYILNDIRNSASKDSSSRLSLLTRKDIHNIKSSLLKDKQVSASAMKSNEKLINDLNNIHNKHAESEQVRADIVKIEQGWVLTSSEYNEIYLIKENSKSCYCPLICSYCKVCIKSYSCSCSESSVEGNMCKHIHFFCMESNKRHDVPDSNESLDSNDDDDDIKNASNTEHGQLQTNNIFLLNKLRTNKLYIDFVSSDERNMLKNKFSDLVDSIKTKEQYKFFESAIEDLTAKLKPIQSCPLNNDDDAVVPASSHRLEPVNENIQDQHNSNSQKTVHNPLIIRFLDPVKEGAKVCYISFAKAKANNAG